LKPESGKLMLATGVCFYRVHLQRTKKGVLNMSRIIAVTVLVIVAISQYSWAQEIVANEPVTVTAPSVDVRWMRGGSDSIPVMLYSEPGVLVNAQGGPSVQSDISIRGSSFSGAGVSINGLSMGNPQTEHFNTEHPLPASLFARPMVLTGYRQASEVEGHLVGTVSLEPAKISGQSNVEIGAGEEGRNWQNFVYQHSRDVEGGDRRCGVSVFGMRESADKIDHPDNDLDVQGGGIHLQSSTAKSKIDILAGVQDKEFGARGYYGVTPSLAADEKTESLLLLVGGEWLYGAGSDIRVATARRRITDDYFLRPGIYTNMTESDVLSGAVDGRHRFADAVSLRWRVGAEAEEMKSLQLGDHDREKGTAVLLPELVLGRVTVAAGSRAQVFSGESTEVLPQGGVSFAVEDEFDVFASYSETVRQPSYTELNYDSPGSLGNSGLALQTAESVSIGCRWEPAPDSQLKIEVFHRQSENTVDWIKTSGESRWLAENLGEVTSVGCELSGSHAAGETLMLRAGYTYLEKDADIDVYASRYVLDYPEHLLELSLVWRPLNNWELAGTQIARKQVRNAVRTTDSKALNGHIALRWRSDTRDTTIALRMANPMDEDFEVFPGQLASERRLSASVSRRF
jgi:vitamin B12 transporter